MKREELKLETVYRLTRDVPNPFGDKRRKYGSLRDLPIIPAGTIFRTEGWREVYSNNSIALGTALPRAEIIEQQTAVDPYVVSLMANGDPYERFWLNPPRRETDARLLAKHKQVSASILSNIEEVRESFGFWLIEEKISDAEVKAALVRAVESNQLPETSVRAAILAIKSGMAPSNVGPITRPVNQPIIPDYPQPQNSPPHRH